MTEATCYANTDDGELIKDDVAWAAARDAVASEICWTIYGTVSAGADWNGSIYTLKRAMHFFDTSGIPAGNKIFDARIWIRGGAQTNTQTLYVVKHTATAPLTSAAFDEFVWANGRCSDSFTLSNGVWKEIPLNKIARDAIVMGAGGLAKLGIMAVDDYNNTAPTGSSMSAHASGNDATYKPYLKVKYGISQPFPTYVQ